MTARTAARRETWRCVIRRSLCEGEGRASPADCDNGPPRGIRQVCHKSCDLQHRAHSTHRCVHSTPAPRDRKSTRLNSSHDQISYAVFCLKKKKKQKKQAKDEDPSADHNTIGAAQLCS